ncbi:MAG: TVP38/TMEM64 family protein [Cyanobacteria bacterium P01_C01_bin.69]
MYQGQPPLNESFSPRIYWAAGLAVSLIVLISVLVYKHPGMQHFVSPESLSVAVTQAGPWGPLLYIAVIALSVVISQIPGAPLAVVAGALWPPLLAGLYTVIGGFSGAMIAYALGKTVGQPLVKALTGKTLSFSADHGEKTLGWMIFITRLVPVFSFDLVSYGAGMAGLSLPIYAGATLFGMVPSTLLLTYAGDSMQFSSATMLELGGVFAVAFVGIPLLMHRYNWLNIRSLVNWES